MLYVLRSLCCDKYNRISNTAVKLFGLIRRKSVLKKFKWGDYLYYFKSNPIWILLHVLCSIYLRSVYIYSMHAIERNFLLSSSSSFRWVSIIARRVLCGCVDCSSSTFYFCFVLSFYYYFFCFLVTYYVQNIIHNVYVEFQNINRLWYPPGAWPSSISWDQCSLGYTVFVCCWLVDNKKSVFRSCFPSVRLV